MTATPSTALDQYVQAMRELQARVVEGQRGQLLDLASRMAETTRRDRRIFLFGTGHSHLIAEEGFYRAGGLANVVPILTEHLMLHHLPALGSRLERTPDLAEMILERYAPQPEEMLFVFSNSGVNRLPVEMAVRGREREMFVVGVSSFAYARQAPLSALGLRLDQGRGSGAGQRRCPRRRLASTGRMSLARCSFLHRDLCIALELSGFRNSSTAA